MNKQRYVTQRVDRSGRVRWYWQRRGHPLTRLPDDLADRIPMTESLNNAADARQIEPKNGQRAPRRPKRNSPKRSENKLRYVTRRVGKRGKVRWYWQRKGHPVTRLPDDLAARITAVERLNNAVDAFTALRPSATARGTIGWIIARYRESDEYKVLAPNTVKYYRRFLNDIEALGPQRLFSAFTRQAVIDFIEGYELPSQRRQSAAVLKNLFGVARYYGFVENDQTTDLRLKSSKPRERIWSDEEIERWIGVAEHEDPAMVTSFLLLRYTAQRPGDALRMTWPAYSGTHIRLRQQKTKKLLDVPIHRDLAAHLDALPRYGTCLTIVASRGRPVSYRRFLDRFNRICALAGIEGAQPRDLRRTAMVNMALGGATVPMIAAVSGHSIEVTTRILETYLPRNTQLAEAGIARLVDYQNTRSQERAKNTLD